MANVKKSARSESAPGKQAASGRERDLRRVIIETALELLNEQGLSEFSMREVARRAQVTHQAPYHHFGDRESILAALVEQGFESLAGRLAAANALAGTLGRRSAMLASGEAYVEFALSQPGLFRIMFRPDVCDPARFSGIQHAGDKTYAELDRLITIIHGTQDADRLASIYWAHVHGMACLMIDGPLALQFPTYETRLAYFRSVSEQFADIVMPFSHPEMPAAGE